MRESLHRVPRVGAWAAKRLAHHAGLLALARMTRRRERAIVMRPGETIDDGDLLLRGAPDPKSETRISQGDVIDIDFAAGPVRVEDVEVALLSKALEFTGGNQAQSARLLGLSRDALRYRMEKYGLR